MQDNQQWLTESFSRKIKTALLKILSIYYITEEIQTTNVLRNNYFRFNYEVNLWPSGLAPSGIKLGHDSFR